MEISILYVNLHIEYTYIYILAHLKLLYMRLPFVLFLYTWVENFPTYMLKSLKSIFPLILWVVLPEFLGYITHKYCNFWFIFSSNFLSYFCFELNFVSLSNCFSFMCFIFAWRICIWIHTVIFNISEYFYMSIIDHILLSLSSKLKFDTNTFFIIIILNLSLSFYSCFLHSILSFSC